MDNFGEKVSFIWSVADLIRDTFKRGKYQDVILPFTVLRRLDCVLEPTKAEVVACYNRYKQEMENLDSLLCKKSGFAFYNNSPYNFQKLLEDANNLGANLKQYINSFSSNMQEVLAKFDFPNTIKKLEDANLLFLVMERFKNLDLHPDKVSNLEMGYIFEELIRKFNEALDENPGEHFTPREVIQLMVSLLLAPDKEKLQQEYLITKVYDPCCGSGGMLAIAKEWIEKFNPTAKVYLYGQEVNPETFAVCKSDFYLKSKDGKEAENIKFGSTLSQDQHEESRFDYLLANPPYGKDWKRDRDAVQKETEGGDRFAAGTPRISDGQLLFLQHMLARMQRVEEGGSRVAIVTNGSPLFTGDAGSGESEIRRWILEHDWLEAIVALPEQLFYNTGIATYIWILSNRKEAKRLRKVQLINATDCWLPMGKSLGDKRREISLEQIEAIKAVFESFTDSVGVREAEVQDCGLVESRIFDREDFGYRKVTVERPLRLNFQALPWRIEKLKQEKAFVNLGLSKKKNAQVKAMEEAMGRSQQKLILEMLHGLPATLFKDRTEFEKVLKQGIKKGGLKLKAPLYKGILAVLSQRDETAAICADKQGGWEADGELRDTEKVGLKESVEEYFARYVKPHVEDAWINETVRDEKDGKIGKVGYEINFNRYFYRYQPPRALEEIEAEIKAVEEEILQLLGEVGK